MQRINIYDIYADVCLPKHVHNEVTQLGLQLGQHPANNTVSISAPGMSVSTSGGQCLQDNLHCQRLADNDLKTTSILDNEKHARSPASLSICS